jgi:hypothetical protein
MLRSDLAVVQVGKKPTPVRAPHRLTKINAEPGGPTTVG